MKRRTQAGRRCAVRRTCVV